MEPDIVRRSVEGLRNWSAARWREYGFRLVLELLVVFIGVYGASACRRGAAERLAETIDTEMNWTNLALIKSVGSRSGGRHSTEP